MSWWGGYDSWKLMSDRDAEEGRMGDEHYWEDARYGEREFGVTFWQATPQGRWTERTEWFGDDEDAAAQRQRQLEYDCGIVAWVRWI